MPRLGPSLALLLVASTAGCPGDSAAEKALKDTLARHQTALEDEQLDQAVALPKEALKANPGEPSLLAAQATAELALGDVTGARRTLDAGIKGLTNTKPATQRHKARFRGLVSDALLLSGKAKDAVDEAGRATSLAPDLAFVRSRSGRALIARNKPEKALEYLDAAVRLEPETAEWYALRGLAHALTGNTGAASAEYKLALAKDSGCLEAALPLALSGVDAGPLKAIAPKGPWSQARRAFALGELDGAALSAAAESDPWETRRPFLKAEAWRLKGVKAESEGHLGDAVQHYRLCTGSAEGGLSRAWCEARMGRLGAP